MEKEDKKTVSPPLNVATHFAWLRTRMAAERTLEAWVRTAISLIGFGFTIVKFFERLNQIPGVPPPEIRMRRFMSACFLLPSESSPSRFPCGNTKSGLTIYSASRFGTLS